MMRKVLVIFLVIMFVWTTPVALAEKKAKDAPAKGTEEVMNRPEIRYDKEGLSEPFRPTVGKRSMVKETDKPKEIPVPEFTVEGIIRSSNFNQAIINNRIVKIGDIIEGAKVVRIEKSGITLLFYDKQIILPAPIESGANIPKED